MGDRGDTASPTGTSGRWERPPGHSNGCALWKAPASPGAFLRGVGQLEPSTQVLPRDDAVAAARSSLAPSPLLSPPALQPSLQPGAQGAGLGRVGSPRAGGTTLQSSPFPDDTAELPPSRLGEQQALPRLKVCKIRRD